RPDVAYENGSGAKIQSRIGDRAYRRECGRPAMPVYRSASSFFYSPDWQCAEGLVHAASLSDPVRLSTPCERHSCSSAAQKSISPPKSTPSCEIPRVKKNSTFGVT